MKSSKQITLPLDAIIELALGSEFKGTRQLPSYEVALIIHHAIKDDLLFKVQFEEHSGEPLKYPKLWSYAEWLESNTNWKRQKNTSEKARVAGWIEKANIKIVAAQLMELFDYTQDQANAIGYSWVKGKHMAKIRVIGIKKLVTKEEELI